jgi:PAS domain S-box-containing protein
MAIILVVDDVSSNRDYLVTILEDVGHRLLVAGDGAEAMSMIRAERPDLVIADILMPTMDGYELVRQLRAESSLARIPVIFCTAHYRELEAKALARVDGVSSVISKPSEPEIVLGAVQAALRPESSRQPIQTAEDFNLEPLRLLTDKLSQKAHDLRLTNGRLSAMVDEGPQLGSELNFRRLLTSFCETAREITGGRYSIAGILDRDGSRLQSVVTSGLSAEAVALLGTPSLRVQAITAVLKESRSVCLHNPGGDPTALGFSPEYPDIHSWLGAPIVSPAGVHGYIALIDKASAGEFSPEDQRLAGILAAQVGRIYHNGTLYSELSGYASDLEREVLSRQHTEKALAERVLHGALNVEVGAILTGRETIQRRLEMCVEALARRLDMTLVRVWAFNEAERVLELATSATTHIGFSGPQQDRIYLGQLDIGRIADGLIPNVDNDLATHRERADWEWASRNGIVAFAGYPLSADGQILGVVGAYARFSLAEPTLEAISWVARQMALALERDRAHESRRESEARIRLLLESTAEAVYGLDLDGCCTFANLACARALRFDHPSRLIGQSTHALIHHSHADGTPYPAGDCKAHRVIRQGKACHVDDEVFWRSDGSCIPVEYWCHPIISKGQIVGSVVRFRDITGQRDLESEFRQSQERLRQVVLSSPAVLFTLAVTADRLLPITWISENLLEILGYGIEAIRDPEWWGNCVHPDDRDRVMTETRTELFGPGHSNKEYRFRHARGHYVWTRCEIRLIRDLNGHPVEAVGSWSDISDWKAIQQEKLDLEYQLREHSRQVERRLQQVVISSPAVLFTVSTTTDAMVAITWISENLPEILGYSLREAMERDWWTTNTHPEDRDRVVNQTTLDLFANDHAIVEYRFRHERGHYVWNRCDIRLIRDDAGQAVEAVGAWSDISDWKLTQEDHSKLRDQLQRAQKMESVGRLAGGVAHDFNNLLTVINGYSDMLMRKLPSDDPSRELVKEIRDAGGRAATLSGQLLVLSRRQLVQVEAVDLNEIIVEFEKMLVRVIGDNIEMQSSLSPSVGSVLADPGQLHQILMNLAINARDAMPNGGTLLIETAKVDLDQTFTDQHPEVQPGSYIQLKVSDTGVGMTPEVMSHLFEPFYTTKAVGEGTGLGLATVYSIVKQMGGSIWVYSELGQGTTLKLYLPLVESEQSPAAPRPAISILGGSETILLVEDQEQLRKMAGRILRESGYTVCEAANPQEALLHVERYAAPIHLLLTDLVMPGMSGRELADRLKSLRPAMKVMFMSGYSERSMLDRGVLEANSNYLSKPFSPEALGLKVRELLGRERREVTVVVADDDPGVRRVLLQALTIGGYTVLEANTGKEAVRQIEVSEVDLLITDLAMPDQEGLETIRLLRVIRPQLKIIAVSGLFGGSLLRTAELLGADASLPKPIDMALLLEAVGRLMQLSGREVSNVSI